MPAAAGGDRAAIGRLISLVERGGEPARQVARLTFRGGGSGYTIGITGAPGAGKSTLTDRLITAARHDGHVLGVLAIDPTSPYTGGAILGDRVRMQGHALDDGVFIRSMATRGHLGGLALAAPEAVRVLMAAGIGLVFIETVGVGQVEVEVAGAADTTAVVVNPGWGDAIQANKAGLLEIADIFVINKSDRPGAVDTRRDLDNMLDMNSFMGEWRPPILATVAATGEGVAELWSSVAEHRAWVESSGELVDRRRRRLLDELSKVIMSRLEGKVHDLESGEAYRRIQEKVAGGTVDPYAASDQLLAMLGL